MSEHLQTIGTSEESIPCFIRKTYKILEDDKYSDIISWNEDGTAVIIHSPSDFAQNILPTYFKHNNLNSFIRQLNMYDFHKKKTPDGEHVYYHELFQRDKKHLLKNIRRKNAENSNTSNEKSRLGLELVRTKQDIAAIVNENLLLKKMNREALTAVSNLENKVNELTLQNQALWSQVLKYNEKEEIYKSLVPGLKRDSPSFPLSTLDFNISNNMMSNKIPQTTTRIPNFSADIGTSKVWNLNQDSSEDNNPLSMYNSRITTNRSQYGLDDRRNKSSKNNISNQDECQNQNLDPNLAADLSQRIVRNMDQELQYLKKLTSSNIRSTNNHSLSSSPGESSILGKRRTETDPGIQNLSAFENITKLYKPDTGFGFNLLANSIKSEGMEDGN